MTIAQPPNPPIIIAFIAFLSSFIPNTIFHIFGLTVGCISLLIWAFLEITAGINWFRRMLGWIILVMLIAITTYGAIIYF